MYRQHIANQRKKENGDSSESSSPFSTMHQRQRCDKESDQLPPSYMYPLAAGQLDAHAANRPKSPSASVSPPSPCRLSSGSACETCRRRKTKCDGGHPCAFCASNRIECIHRPTRKKKILRTRASFNDDWPSSGEQTSPVSFTGDEPKVALHKLSKQASCPSLAVNDWPTVPVHKRQTEDSPVSLFAHGKMRSEECMPSIMDQLSCRTFLAAVDQRQNYPIYPLTHSPSPSLRQVQPSETLPKQCHDLSQ